MGLLWHLAARLVGKGEAGKGGKDKTIKGQSPNQFGAAQTSSKIGCWLPFETLEKLS